VPGCFRATCNTGAVTAAKVAVCEQMLGRQPGCMVRCTFSAASSGASTLDINSTGAASVVDLDGNAASWLAGDEIILQFDGSRWVVLLNISEEVRKGQELRYYGVCNTVGTSLTKVVSINDFQLKTGVRVAIKFSQVNTAKNVKLNITNTGAKPLLLNGASVPPNLFAKGAVLLIQYDGASYNILGDQSAATESQLGRVRTSDTADSSKSAADGWAASTKALAAYVQSSEKATAGGVATLAKDGKVESGQLRGGWVLAEKAPSDTTLLWIQPTGIMKYYDGSAWANVLVRDSQEMPSSCFRALCRTREKLMPFSSARWLSHPGTDRVFFTACDS
jgi:hypothetical protein